HSHKQIVTSASKGEGSVASVPFEVKVGGATVFVVDVDKFVKL
ncbi:MAG: cyclic-di-AMP receptor, partial [Clostridia bacterium]|nr:cyclic-di-AMP receptor [Clostridia bacterium]